MLVGGPAVEYSDSMKYIYALFSGSPYMRDPGESEYEGVPNDVLSFVIQGL